MQYYCPHYTARGKDWMTVFVTLLFPARQNNLMVWTRDGVWVPLKNYIDPEKAEARAKKDELDRKRRANRHLFDREARCWKYPKIILRMVDKQTRYACVSVYCYATNGIQI